MADFLNPYLESLIAQLKEDVTLSEMTLRERALMCPAIKVKWVRQMHIENAKLKQYKKAESVLLEKFIAENVSKGTARYVAESTADSVPDIAKIRTAIVDQEQTVACVREMVNTVIGGIGYEISAAKDILKLEQSV